MSKPLLIGLSGRAGSGKSTVAGCLTAVHGYHEKSFANALKWEVREVIDDRLRAPLEAEPLLTALGAGETDPFKKPTSLPMRRLLQWWGTEYRRSQDPAYWLKAINIPPGVPVVISDVRFPNEADYIRVLGGELWEVTGRSDPSVPSHASEELLFCADGILENNGSLKDLYQKIDEEMRHYDDN